MTTVYRHIREDKDEPFYIGIGSVNRAKSKHERNSIWNKIVAKTKYSIEILLECDTREEAMEKEKEFISLYGRKNINTGCLANMTNGGEGTVNVVFTEERKALMSNRYSGKGNPRAKKVYCGYLDKIFDTISDCAIELGVSQPYLSRMIKGTRVNKFKLSKI